MLTLVTRHVARSTDFLADFGHEMSNSIYNINALSEVFYQFESNQ
jgi:hypothetical protein